MHRTHHWPTSVQLVLPNVQKCTVSDLIINWDTAEGAISKTTKKNHVAYGIEERGSFIETYLFLSRIPAMLEAIP